jgi:hypothetical protein
MGGAGGIVFFSVPNSYKGAMDRAKGGEYYISKPQWSSRKIYASGSPSSGLKRSISFLKISRDFLCIFCRKDQQSYNGWAA